MQGGLDRLPRIARKVHGTNNRVSIQQAFRLVRSQ